MLVLALMDNNVYFSLIKYIIKPKLIYIKYLNTCKSVYCSISHTITTCNIDYTSNTSPVFFSYTLAYQAASFNFYYPNIFRRDLTSPGALSHPSRHAVKSSLHYAVKCLYKCLMKKDDLIRFSFNSDLGIVKNRTIT